MLAFQAAPQGRACIVTDEMSISPTSWAAELGQALAPEAGPPIEPEPEGDVVEAYSFNTGT